MPSFQPYWGKPAVRNDRGGRGDVGIIRSPVRASILPDCGGRPVMGVPTAIPLGPQLNLDHDRACEDAPAPDGKAAARLGPRGPRMCADGPNSVPGRRRSGGEVPKPPSRGGSVPPLSINFDPP